MSPKQRHIKEPLSVAVLQAYLEGTLSPEEQQQVEAIMEQSPYYKEVLEGLRWTDDEYKVSERMTQWQDAIQARTTSPSTKTVPLYRKWVRWAAAAVVLGSIITAGLWISGQLEKKDPVIAQKIKPADDLTQPNINPTLPTETTRTAPPPPDQMNTPASPAPIEEELDVVANEEEMIAEEPAMELSVVEDTEAYADLSAPVQDSPRTLSRQQTQMAPASGNTSIEPQAAKQPHSDFAIAIQQYEMAQYARAITLLQQVVADDPNAEAYWWLGQSYLALGDTNSAVTALQKVLTYGDSPRLDTTKQQLKTLR